jgi:hypothetical protein
MLAYDVPPDTTPLPLLIFLATDPSPSDLAQALEEFAWRSLIEGRRVRKWCADITALIEAVSAEYSGAI